MYQFYLKISSMYYIIDIILLIIYLNDDEKVIKML